MMCRECPISAGDLPGLMIFIPCNWLVHFTSSSGKEWHDTPAPLRHH
jgi:hypothetical protein